MRIRRALALTAAVVVAGGGAGFAAARTCGLPEFSSSPLLLSTIQRIDPERAHRLAVRGSQLGLFWQPDDPAFTGLRSELWGRSFENPIGLAAGFDKDAECIEGMLAAGFGYVEVGSVTPEPQPGNPTPRVFRLHRDRAVINRYGFNSQGADAAASNLERFRASNPGPDATRPAVLAVNLGKNKLTADATTDYVTGVRKLARFADVLVVNVSSPNTPGLRSLQGREQLRHLLQVVKSVLPGDSTTGHLPLLVKIAPDLTADDKKDIAEVVLEVGVDGIIISNTTIARPAELKTPDYISKEAGGLSGEPLFEMSTIALSDMYKLTGGRVPLVGVGGVSTGEQAYQKIRAGASLVQLYSSLVYEGPAVVNKIKRELLACLERDGFATVSEAVGANHK